MTVPGARYWNTRLVVVKNCLEVRLGQYSRHTYMSVVGSHVTCMRYGNNVFHQFEADLL